MLVLDFRDKINIITPPMEEKNAKAAHRFRFYIFYAGVC